MIAVDGRLQSRTYEDKNGTKHYITELIIENANFTGEKSDGGNYQNNSYNQSNGFNQNNGGFANQYQQTPQQTNNGFNGDAQNVGDLSEFEDVLSDDGVPF
jgi:single-strand DNA-binding protein